MTTFVLPYAIVVPIPNNDDNGDDDYPEEQLYRPWKLRLADVHTDMLTLLRTQDAHISSNPFTTHGHPSLYVRTNVYKAGDAMCEILKDVYFSKLVQDDNSKKKERNIYTGS